MHGTRFVKQESVHKGNSYRNLLLAAGICVAVLVAFTFWVSRKRSNLAQAGQPTTLLAAGIEAVSAGKVASICIRYLTDGTSAGELPSNQNSPY
jgi:hypothetical protein